MQCFLFCAWVFVSEDRKFQRHIRQNLSIFKSYFFSPIVKSSKTFYRNDLHITHYTLCLNPRYRTIDARVITLSSEAGNSCHKLIWLQVKVFCVLDGKILNKSYLVLVFFCFPLFLYRIGVISYVCTFFVALFFSLLIDIHTHSTWYRYSNKKPNNYSMNECFTLYIGICQPAHINIHV